MEQPEKHPQPLITQWECSVQNLSDALYSRFQHASQYNPIQNSNFSISKIKQSSLTNSPYTTKSKFLKNDQLFHGCDQYRLPIVQSFYRNRNKNINNVIKKDVFGKNRNAFRNDNSIKNQGEGLETGIFSNWMSRDTGRATNNIKSKPINQSGTITGRTNCDNIDWKSQISYFKQAMFSTLKFAQKDKYFSYFYIIVELICNSILQSKQKRQIMDSLIQDMQLLLTTIDKKKSVISTIKYTLAFKNQNKYFEFKHPQIRMLFHILGAELEHYENKLQKSIFQYQYCQYFCRKENLQPLTLCFLWENACINISILKYEEADACLRNLIQMVIVCKKKKAIKFIYEKISLLYYYRGNSIMGHYYLKKSETGLSTFQNDIFNREYNRNDQIKRLEHRLFNLPIAEQIVKRKNNPKFQCDVWRQSKQQHEKRVDTYMHTVNQMLKDHQHTKFGKKIKIISHQISLVGNFKSKHKHKQSQSLHRFTHNSHQSVRNSFNQDKQQKRESSPNTNTQQLKQKRMPNRKQLAQQNVTKVVKTHLSMNRQNNYISRQQRWRKFISFVFNLDTKMREIGQPRKQLETNLEYKNINSRTMPKIGNVSNMTSSTLQKKNSNTV